MGFKVRCLRCGDIIESKWLHDFVSCSCGKVAVDGGDQYFRVCGNYGDWELVVLAEEFAMAYATKMNTVRNCLDFTDKLTISHYEYWNPSRYQIIVRFVDDSVFVADVDKRKTDNVSFYNLGIVGYHVVKKDIIGILLNGSFNITKRENEDDPRCKLLFQKEENHA